MTATATAGRRKEEIIAELDAFIRTEDARLTTEKRTELETEQYQEKIQSPVEVLAESLSWDELQREFLHAVADRNSAREALYKQAIEIWKERNLEEEKKPLFVTAAEMLTYPVIVRQLIGKLIEGGCTGQLYGPSGEGKSFLVIDLACCVGTESVWNGHQCVKGLVLYFAGEGHAGIRKRLKAWHMTHCFPAGMENIIVSQSTITLDGAGIRRVISEAREIEERTGNKVALIVIDTLARHIQGDENSTRDMVEFIRSVETVRNAFPDATALVVHHSGHGPDNSNRSRGSSALKAALDYEIQCNKGVLTFQKVKDGEIPSPMEFKLIPVEVGTDDDGDPITSCYVAYGERSAKHRETTLTTTEKELLELIKENPGVLSGDLRTVFFDKRKERDPDVKHNTVKKAFNRALEGLTTKGQAYIDGHSVLPGQGQKQDKAGTCPDRGYTGTAGHTLYNSVSRVPSHCPAPEPVDDILLEVNG